MSDPVPHLDTQALLLRVSHPLIRGRCDFIDSLVMKTLDHTAWPRILDIDWASNRMVFLPIPMNGNHWVSCVFVVGANGTSGESANTASDRLGGQIW